jgi:phenylalanyl-tRNA synthetase alpha chain
MKDTDITKLIERINSAKTEAELSALRVEALGRKSLVAQALRAVGALADSERAQAGAEANAAATKLETALRAAEQRLMDGELEQASKAAPLDVTVPSKLSYGHAHPVTALIDELVRVFWQMGYEVADGPEIENEWYNFEALNLGPDHPAREMQDTFYLEEAHLPRTHTSGVQVRHMEKHQPPIRIIAPGKVYRNEDEDARHVWMFHQIEGLVVDRGISLADLKGTLLAMMRGVLGDDVNIRLRPSYFPYTEPSVELDATCVVCGGKGCNTCSGTGWLELGGAGMVHPQVLRNVGIDPEEFSGFAFGFGPERIASIKYGIPDIREFWRPNLKFLEQF